MHSYGKLIPNEFPITNLHQIVGPDGIGRITCTVKGQAGFAANGLQLSHGVYIAQMTREDTATLVVNLTNHFQNKGMYCTKNNANKSFFYLFIFEASEYNYKL